MAEIKSNGDIARGHASSLKAAISSLAGVGGITMDSQTTLSGNASAHSNIGLTENLPSQIEAAFSSASEHLHSVVSDFEAVDSEGAASFKGE